MRAGDRRRRRGRDRQRPGDRRPGRGVGRRWPTAKIPRVASNVTQDDWGDPNAYPMDASGTGVTFLMPQALIDAGAKKIGLIRVDLAAASALVGLLERHLQGQGHLPLRRPGPGRHHRLQPVHPRRAERRSRRRGPGARRAGGHPDREGRPAAGHRAAHRIEPRHVLAQERHRARRLRQADGVHLVVPAGDHRPPRLRRAARRPRRLRRGGAPAREPQGQPDALVDRPLRPAQDDPRRQDDRRSPARASSTMLNEAKDVPMLDIFGGEDWTPSTDHPGIYKRAGTNHWATYKWDPDGQGARRARGQLRRDSRRSASTRCSAARSSALPTATC